MMNTNDDSSRIDQSRRGVMAGVAVAATAGFGLPLGFRGRGFR